MKKYIVSGLFAVLFGLTSFAAHASDAQDMAKITCKDFLADQANMPLMLMWIDGYMSGKSDNTMMDSQWIEKLGTHLGTFCGKNPTKTIMQAIEAME